MAHYSMKNKGSNFNGIHEFITGALELSLNEPENTTSRFLLAESFSLARKVDKNLEAQYLKKIELLNKEFPIPERYSKIVEGILKS
jgi:hypothetical protein